MAPEPGAEPGAQADAQAPADSAAKAGQPPSRISVGSQRIGSETGAASACTQISAVVANPSATPGHTSRSHRRESPAAAIAAAG